MNANNVVLDINFIKHIVKCFEMSGSEDVETRSIIDITIDQLRNIIKEHEDLKNKELLGGDDEKVWDTEQFIELLGWLAEEADEDFKEDFYDFD